MIREVWIGATYNLYESKRYFSRFLSEAMERKGIKALVLDQTREEIRRFFGRPEDKRTKPDFFCSFNRSIPNEKGEFFWDVFKIPNLSMLVDPAVYDCDLLKSHYSIISCVDKFDCDFVRKKHFERVFFMPHAVERDLGPGEVNDRPYDVVFLGSSYDPAGLKSAWQKKFPNLNWPVIEEAIDLCLLEPAMTFWNAAEWVIKKAPETEQIVQKRFLLNYIDNYIRGIDRLEMIKSIKNAHVHVFGGTCWRKETPIRGWPQEFAKSPNVTVHPSISFGESMEILKKSKICLNSMPFFKNGTHERIFTGLACGSLPITTENLWVKKNFVAGEELLLYRPKQWDEINTKVDYYLANETERKRIAAQGREKVMREHTWDNRVDLLLEVMPAMLKSFA